MKQTYLVHYYIVGYIKRKEEKYLISLGRFTYFIPRYLGFKTSEFDLSGKIAFN